MYRYSVTGIHFGLGVSVDSVQLLLFPIIFGSLL
jgi:hypothetical protein